MNATSVNPLNIRVQGTDRKFRCPRCGCVMEETERMAENGSLYIWYECSAPECDEQWLAKIMFEGSKTFEELLPATQVVTEEELKSSG